MPSSIRTGQQHRFSVVPWGGSDPDTTWVSFAFVQSGENLSTASSRHARSQLSTHHAEIVAIGDGNSAWKPAGDSEAPNQAGSTLRELRRRIGGDEGFVHDATGVRYRVSLRQWSDFDPDLTRLLVTFVKNPPSSI